ncbi:MAG TPA: phage minor head protein [Alphaproteobacteria bacterium]|nr:phage minor head protein [Alphaproteobacteria bacterium]
MAIDLIRFPISAADGPLAEVWLDDGVVALVPAADVSPKAFRDDVPDEFYTALHRIADRLAPSLRRRFFEAVDAMQSQIDVSAFLNAMRAGLIDQAMAAIPLDHFAERFGLAEHVLRQGVQLAGESVATEVSGLIGLEFRFDVTNPHAVTAAATRSAELVREVTDTTRLGIRAWIERAFVEGIPPEPLARRLREIVGLTTRQTDAVEAMRARLLDQGIDADRVERLTAKYAEALLRQRAETIARTELMTAVHRGQQEAWRQAQEAGHLPDATTRRVWITTPDDRLDESCLVLEGVTTRLGEPFPGGLMHPPLHPRCRCTTAIVFVEAEA